jgi:hypothetical protein
MLRRRRGNGYRGYSTPLANTMLQDFPNDGKPAIFQRSDRRTAHYLRHESNRGRRQR